MAYVFIYNQIRIFLVTVHSLNGSTDFKDADQTGLICVVSKCKAFFFKHIFVITGLGKIVDIFISYLKLYVYKIHCIFCYYFIVNLYLYKYNYCTFE